MRPGEQIGLNWDDLQDGTLTVRAGSVQLKGQKCTRTEKPKTKKSVRKIYLPPVVVKALAKWKSEQAQYRLKFKDAWQSQMLFSPMSWATAYELTVPPNDGDSSSRRTIWLKLTYTDSGTLTHRS